MGEGHDEKHWQTKETAAAAGGEKMTNYPLNK
jgi:hypothetical protein